MESKNSVYDKVACDNSSERSFAEDMDKNAQVKVFCKLPQKYYISTPTGDYRPDWAIIYEKKTIGGKPEARLHLVRETKFGYVTLMRGTLKSISSDEQNKVDCAKKHFEEVGGLDYTVVRSYDEFVETLPNR